MTPASIASISKTFFRAYELCFRSGLPAEEGEPNALVPAVVCLAFSLELATKSLLTFHNRPARGHDLWELYEGLPDNVRQDIVRLCGVDPSVFGEKLRLVANAFVEWRYIYEKRGTNRISLQFLLQLHFALDRLVQTALDEDRARSQGGRGG